MIDLHTHTTLSDGALIPAEQIRRAETKGYRILGMSDHGDLATMETILPAVLTAARRENELARMIVLAGIEFTHVRPAHIAECVRRARELGAHYVIVHGETLAEPVEAGTNLAAIEAGADILAHPGLITPDEVKLAARKGVRLEITAKRGHCLANGHVAKLAMELGAQMCFGSDAHDPDQMISRHQAERICMGAGIPAAHVAEMFPQAEQFARGLLKI